MYICKNCKNSKEFKSNTSIVAVSINPINPESITEKNFICELCYQVKSIKKDLMFNCTKTGELK